MYTPDWLIDWLVWVDLIICPLFRDGIAYVDPRGDGRYIITNSKDQVIHHLNLSQQFC